VRDNNRILVEGAIFSLLLILLLDSMFGIFDSSRYSFSDEDDYIHWSDWEDMKDDIDTMQMIYNRYLDVTNRLAGAHEYIDTLENTDWYLQYNLTFSELQKERANYPNAYEYAITCGVSVGFCVAIIGSMLFLIKNEKVIEENKNLKILLKEKKTEEAKVEKLKKKE